MGLRKIWACSWRPVCPLYMTSQPRLWYPHLCSAALMLSTVTSVKGVASPSLPIIAATCARARARVSLLLLSQLLS